MKSTTRITPIALQQKKHHRTPVLNEGQGLSLVAPPFKKGFTTTRKKVEVIPPPPNVGSG
jgi:hypothetical protein